MAILGDLLDAYPRQEVRTPTVRLYAEKLADLPADYLDAAVDDLICTKTFFPSIAEIRERTAEVMLSLPTDAAALTQIEDRLAWTREDELSRGPRPEVHPIVKETVEHVGGYFALRSAEKPEIVRSQFLRLYKERRDEEIRSGQRRRRVPILRAVPVAEIPA